MSFSGRGRWGCRVVVLLRPVHQLPDRLGEQGEKSRNVENDERQRHLLKKGIIYFFNFFYFHKSDVKLQFCHTWWSRKKISTVYACIWSLFFKWSKPDLFLIFSNTKFHKKWLQRDSNSDRRSKRQASWPLDLHLGPVCPLFLSFQKWHKDLRRVLRRHTFATS